MGTECIMTTLSKDPEPSFPPGFGPFASLTLRSIQNDVKPADTQSTSVQVLQTIKKDVQILGTSSAHCRSGTPCSTSGSSICRKSLRNRPPVDYSLFDLISDDDSDVEIIEKGTTSVRRKQQLPKGVLRGCAECADCQKVVARWNPSGARRPVLDEAPVFYPSEEEFKDTLKYIENIRPKAEPYGICRIVPPPSWKPPCLLKEKNIWECSKFSTRVQKVDKLQNRKSSKKSRKGGMMKKRRKLSEPVESSNINNNQTGMHQNQDRFGFEPGPEFTLQTFKKYADDFSNQYFRKDACEDSQPSVEDIEGEYWRIVERPTEEIEVIYGADLETGTFGSGFPKSSSDVKSDAELKYAQSGWNLNKLPRLQGSVLSFEGGDISGVLVPWVYVGMCFSSFCWHVEDHHLYSLNYMHWGAPKMWYGVPGKDAVNLEAAMRKHLPDLFEEQPDLLHNLVTQFSPSLLKSEGVPVYRCVQHEGEFVLTFPRAYHAGFNCGFNCAEAVNVAPIDWLPIGQGAVELYREQGRKITISHDKLLLGAAREAIRAQWDILFLKRNTADNLRWKSICGPDSTIYKSLKARIEMELKQRQNICSPSQSRKMDSEFDSTDRECAFCYYDLHLSASGCLCCREKYTCLTHAKQLCSCDWDKRFFLFRYDVSELNTLADALGGKLSAIHRWGVSDLGLSLSSCVKREKVQDSTTARKPTDGPRRSYMSQASTVSLRKRKQGFHHQKSYARRTTRHPVLEITCSVEPLEIGYVLSGKLWCSSQAIFPKGFKSRVKYFSIVDPMQKAYYVSEILDAGPRGPLFMVTLENCPGEVFINVSPTKCWNMVRERLNIEIRRQLGTGRANLPTLQPPGSVAGLEMFGFLSPAIVQAIEARDGDRICTEYWKARPRDVVEDRDSWCMPPQVPPHIALRDLFQRANHNELRALRSLLMNISNNLDDSTRQQAVQALEEEIAKRWC
ncbi:hypothetical protein QOZ80_2BG0204370 [Eleusine coracana subsp. coracana]|nr:hypothetical protein QOZ80_2BG0204370 [Eleusine coracana subsp. coracana]